jgi:glycosyltransferase involved in cell wall biosynthesis
MNAFGVEKVLLISGKFPEVTSDTDGGSIMVNHLIYALHNSCILDVIFTRTYNTNFIAIKGVRQVLFHTNKNRHNNKFLRRLSNIEWNSNEFSQHIQNYDRIIIIHCSKAFGLEHLSQNLLNKIVLFPMYLTSAYLRSGEVVPDEYKKAEQKIIPKLSKIISPSQSEKNDIMKDFGVAGNKIVVIPRAVNPFIKSKLRSYSQENKLIYIGAIKKQKRNDDAIILLSKLKMMGLNCHLFLVGSKQDDELFTHCINLMNNLGLDNDITYCGVLNQKEISRILNEVDINISVSRWETFGRGVFEGLSAGLPTVVYNSIDCLLEYANSNAGISFVDNIQSMAEKIYELITNSNLYYMQSKSAIDNSSQFTLKKQNENLIQEIFCK